MAANHGTANRYNTGCRCDACKDSHRLRAAAYRQRRTGHDEKLSTAVDSSVPRKPLQLERFPNRSRENDLPQSPGPVELGVEAELAGLEFGTDRFRTDARPGLTQTALALARIMDNPKAVSHQAAAAKVLTTLLDKLRSASGRGRRGNLSVVKSMTTSSPSA
jgi:hypothetical protein